MAREFDVPLFFRSTLVEKFKQRGSRKEAEGNSLPGTLDFGPVQFVLARRFGFCFGVQNALEMVYRIVAKNPGKRIFLISELIHNPSVNSDLLQRGVRFLMGPGGERTFDFSNLTAEDIVVIPAFGTTLELEDELARCGVDLRRNDATCPFVKKVWRRAEMLAKENFTVIIHGKFSHEETQATFSHTVRSAAALVIRGYDEARIVCDVISGRLPADRFFEHFGDRVSNGFDPALHLRRVGIVNQTTMLAMETEEIADLFRRTMAGKFGEQALAEHFADTRDTLCYATYENQTATDELARAGADLAIVVGGYNSSNTSHLVELLANYMPAYFVCDEREIISAAEIRHFDLDRKEVMLTSPWLVARDSAGPLRIALTAGASCPDFTVEKVMRRILEFFPEAQALKASAQ